MGQKRGQTASSEKQPVPFYVLGGGFSEHRTGTHSSRPAVDLDEDLARYARQHLDAAPGREESPDRLVPPGADPLRHNTDASINIPICGDSI